MSNNIKDTTLEELDLKDKKLLIELFSHEKKHHNDISKKILISKEMMHYRIKRLKADEVLINLDPIIDYLRLGYSIHRLQLKYHSIPKEKKLNS